MADLKSRYLINVAAKTAERAGYVHYCSIEIPESKASEKAAITKLLDMCERFPEPDFRVTMTYWEIRGTDIPA